MKKIILTLASLAVHGIAIGLLLYVFLPVAKWYTAERPLFGIDFYLTVNLASLLREHLVLPHEFWNYGWFGGFPQFLYPPLTVYLIGILSKFWEMLYSVQIVVMSFAFLFGAGAYFLFFRISKNHVLAFSLAVFTVLSGGVYETLTWAGSIPSFCSQAGLPWTLGFLIWFKETEKYRYLLASFFVAGLSVLIHPLVFVAYILPSAVILISLNFEKGISFFPKLKQLAIFGVGAFLVGFLVLYASISAAIKTTAFKQGPGVDIISTTRVPSDLAEGIAQFNKAQVARVLNDNHEGIFIICAVLLVLFVATLVFSRRLSSLIGMFPYVVLVGYFLFYIWLFGQGISIYHGGWYRLFWSVPIWVGILASAAWFYSEKNLHKVVGNVYLKIIFVLVADLLIIFLGYSHFQRLSQGATESLIIYRGEMSSAHPDIFNFRPSRQEIDSYKRQLIPSWLNPDETNYRMYAPDQTVNIWWNSEYKMPLARGYLDPPILDSQRGFVFLLDTGLSTGDGKPQLTDVFDYPEEAARSIALFLLDWGGVKYYEGGHAGGTSSPDFPQHLKDLSVVSKEETINLDSLNYLLRRRTLHYYELKDEVVSPILSATNASVMGIFASDTGYETVVRAIAERGNVNSQRLIPLNLGRNVDDYSLKTLRKFDSLYLYDYDYDDWEKTAKLLDAYLREGKKVFIETGEEGKQSSGNLPEIFPVKVVERKGLGKEWEIENVDKMFSKDVDFSKFSPTVFDDTEWKMSFSEGADLRPGALVILKNHGKVVMASQKVGSGEIIWSGINFAYHLNRFHNEEEAEFSLNILNSFISSNTASRLPFKATFINANEREIAFEKAKGILFKEQAYDGWHAKLKSEGKSLEIFKAGPAYPGYMYIPLLQEKGVVKLSYDGSLKNKLILVFSFIFSVFIFEEITLRGLILGRVRKYAWKFTKKRMKKWWEREDEE